MIDEQFTIIEPYGFIYITTNLTNGKRYIGQKKFDPEGRWRSYLGSGFYLHKAIKKYGKTNFIRDIVDIGFSLVELNEKEIHWIKILNAVDSEDYYNAIEGGGINHHLNEGTPIVNIDTNYIFKSIKDATRWSGYTRDRIVSTFKFKHNMDIPRNILIFKPLDKLMFKNKLCGFCGKNFRSKNNRIKYCDSCKSHNMYTERMKDKIILPQKNGIMFK